MTKDFWSELKKPFFILAPMEDVTDVIFRHVIKKAAAPDVYFTEFTNSDSYCHPEGEKSVRGRLTFTPDEQPIVGHIWGDNPEHFAKMSQGLKDKGFVGLDINMGCPAPNVVKQGKGSGLIKRPEVAAELIAAAKTSGLPVSVKTRLGYSSLDEWKPWISHLLKQNLRNLSIHLRTKKEESKVPAHYELIPEIVALRNELAPNTLLTINGDIKNYQMGLALAEKYGVDGIMIGRGVFQDPFAFEKEEKEHSVEERIALLRYQLDLQDEYSKEIPRPMAGLHRFFKIYVKGFNGASDLRAKLMNTKSTDEVRALLDEFFE